MASLMCGFGGLAALVMIGITLLASIEQQHHQSELPMVVATGGLILSTVAAWARSTGSWPRWGSPAGRRRSAGRSGGWRSAAGCASWSCSGSASCTPWRPRPPGRVHSAYGRGLSGRGPVLRVMTGILFPLAFAVVLILYHRLLAAARAAVLGESAGRDDG